MREMTVNDQADLSSNISGIKHLELMRNATVIVAAIVAIWQEQVEYSFAPVQLSALIAGMVLLSIMLLIFYRGASRVQPSDGLAVVLRFFGRHTLEIYATQLALSEVIVNLLPGLAP